ncbi:MAG: DUF4105 domain-containing protein [Phycisphaeraceae bacterium]
MLLILSVLLAGAAPARAQVYPELLPATLSADARISVLTMDPGEAVHARFGHSAIRVRDPAQQMDVVFNYGYFSYDDPLFIARFIRGQLDYLLGVDTFDDALAVYQAQRRRVVQQTLRLTAEQRQAAYRLLVDNARPDRDPPPRYRYRFLADNCSTRVLDMVEAVVGERLVLPEPDEPRTYRQAIMAHLQGAPLLRLGIDLGLGRPADELMDARQATFLPLPLMRVIDAASIADAATGELRPLVAEERELYRPGDAAAGIGARGVPLTPAAPPWPAAVLWAMLLMGVACTAWHCRMQRRRGQGWRSRPFADAGLFGVVGVGGLILLGLGVATEHDVTAPNYNMLWAWPTHALAAAALLLWPGHRVMRGYLALTAGAMALLALGWWFVPQPLPLAVLPVALLVGLRAAYLAWVRPAGGEPAL